MQFNEICSLLEGINMRTVDLQAFTYVLVLSETHLFTQMLYLQQLRKAISACLE